RRCSAPRCSGWTSCHRRGRRRPPPRQGSGRRCKPGRCVSPEPRAGAREAARIRNGFVRHPYGVQAVMDGDALRVMVARAADGDELAFARIVAAHHDDMARVAYVMCGEVDLAQEAVQSAWTKAWTRLDTIRDMDRLKPWLVSIAANEAKQLVRSRSRRRVREIPMPDGPAD